MEKEKKIIDTFCITPFDPKLTYASDPEAEETVALQRAEKYASFSFEEEEYTTIYNMLFATNDVAKTACFTGWPAAGKSTFAKWMCAKAGIPAIEILGSQTNMDQIFGANGVKSDGSIGFIPGQATLAVKHGKGLIINEADGLVPELQLTLYPLMDGSSYFVEPTTQQKIKVHPNFRLFLTLNNDRSVGLNKFNPALVSRCHIHKDWPKPSTSDLTKLLEKCYPFLAKAKGNFLEEVAKMSEIADNFGLKIKARYEITLRQLQSFVNYILVQGSRCTDRAEFSVIVKSAFFLNVLNMVTSFSPSNSKQVDDALKSSGEIGVFLSTLTNAWFSGSTFSVDEMSAPEADAPTTLEVSGESASEKTEAATLEEGEPASEKAEEETLIAPDSRDPVSVSAEIEAALEKLDKLEFLDCMAEDSAPAPAKAEPASSTGETTTLPAGVLVFASEGAHVISAEVPSFESLSAYTAEDYAKRTGEGKED
jgi:hypothetical protein